MHSKFARAAPGRQSTTKDPATHGVPGKRTLVESQSHGAPLPVDTRMKFERAFGQDFGDLRVHESAEPAALGAGAFARGHELHFAPGRFAPGSDAGDRLIGHELAHVVQQRGGRVAAPTGDGAPVNGDAALEAEADALGARAARGEVVGGDRGAARSAPASPPAQAAPIQCDQRDTTRLPTANDQLQMRGNLDTSTRVVHGGVPHVPMVRPVWDGHSSQPDHDAARLALFNEVGAGIMAFINANKAAVQRAKTAPRVPLSNPVLGGDTGLVGIARQAQTAIVQDFGAWISGGVRGPGQQPSSAVTLTGGTNVFDGSDKVTRQAVLHQNDEHYAFEPIKWVALNYRQCSDALAAHHWDSAADVEAWPFLQDRVLLPYLRFGGNQAWFTDYHTYMVNEEQPGQVFFDTTTRPHEHGGDTSKADRAKRWELYAKSIHELMHGCAHPRFIAATRNRVVMSEGFTEYFAEHAITPRMFAAATGGDETLRRAVEGGAFARDPSLIPTYTIPDAYAPHVTEVQSIAVRMGEQAVRAAFFQGHVEFLGLAPDGTEGTDLAPTHGAPTLRVPGGVTTFAALATATGVGEGELRTANPVAHEPLGGPLVMPGCREHIVVTSPGTPPTAESRAQIAGQHGVTEPDLIRANPSLGNGAWALAAGDRVLVPRH